nr:GntR family transcriptional regulator [Actinomyces sp. 186855]
MRTDLRALTSSTLADGDRLPSERELATRYEVNRLTVRRAIDALVAEGLVVRRQGAGSFVSRATRTRSLESSFFSAEVRARGHRPGSASVSVSTVAADARLSAVLSVPPSTPLAAVMRLRTIDDVPTAIDHAWIPAHLVPNLNLGAEESLFETLCTRYHLVVEKIDETVSASVLEPRSARMLRSVSMMPALFITKVMRGTSGDPLAYCETLLRGDKYTYRNTVVRKGV